VEGTFGLLQDVLHYELTCAERYRRFVSIVMVSYGQGDTPVRKVIAEKVRESDLLAEKNSHLIILMSETDSAGATTAIHRYKTQTGEGDLRFSLVTFPNDSGTADSLMEAGERRLSAARADQPGAVVTEG